MTHAQVTQITSAWNPGNDSDVAGYKVYRRTTGKAYKKPIGTVENVPNPELSLNVSYGKKYYLAVTSYDIYGNESSPSNEVSWPIQVFSSSGGETITSGSPCLIQWYADSRAEEFELLYSVNKGKSWLP
jgi:fibronectin type 3 domain-containing protein